MSTTLFKEKKIPAALNRQQNVRVLDKVRRPAAIYITDNMRTTPTGALYAMLNWLSTVLLAKQTAKFVATRRNTLSRWHIVPSGHSTILEVDPVNFDYFDLF